MRNSDVYEVHKCCFKNLSLIQLTISLSDSCGHLDPFALFKQPSSLTFFPTLTLFRRLTDQPILFHHLKNIQTVFRFELFLPYPNLHCSWCISFWQILSLIHSAKNNKPDIGIIVRVFANGPGDLGSITGRVIPKTKKRYSAL